MPMPVTVIGRGEMLIHVPVRVVHLARKDLVHDLRLELVGRKQAFQLFAAVFVGRLEVALRVTEGIGQTFAAPADIAREDALLFGRGSAFLALNLLEGLDRRDVVAEFDALGALPEVQFVGDAEICAEDIRRVLRGYVGGGCLRYSASASAASACSPVFPVHLRLQEDEHRERASLTIRPLPPADCSRRKPTFELRSNSRFDPRQRPGRGDQANRPRSLSSISRQGWARSIVTTRIGCP